MHSISTRATVHGRRRNLKGLGVLAGSAVVVAGFTVPAAFAAPAAVAVAPALAIQQTTPSPDLNNPGGSLTFKLTITSTDIASPEEVSDLFLATACTVTPPNMNAVSHTTAGTTGLCPSGDGATALAIQSIEVDHDSLATCGRGSFVPYTPILNETNVNYMVSGVFLQQNGSCVIDVTVAPGGEPTNSPVYLVADVDTVVNGVAGSWGPEGFPVASQINLLPPAAITHTDKPVVHHEDQGSEHSEHSRHETHRCTRDTPNNGNGNLGYGNNGNGNVGNCNNGNGNTGDDNNGNGNGDHDHDHDGNI